jgi:hypothetical protein
MGMFHQLAVLPCPPLKSQDGVNIDKDGLNEEKPLDRPLESDPPKHTCIESPELPCAACGFLHPPKIRNSVKEEK